MTLRLWADWKVYDGGSLSFNFLVNSVQIPGSRSNHPNNLIAALKMFQDHSTATQCFIVRMVAGPKFLFSYMIILVSTQRWGIPKV